jgi:hypothetical protein
MARRRNRLLERGSEQLSIDASVWAEILLLASRWAWKPTSPSYFLLAPNYEVTAEDARSLANAIERIWAAASEDPFNINLTPPVDLGLLLTVGAFCLRGSFVVR